MSQTSDMIVQVFGLQGAETLKTLVSDTNHESEELLDHERVKKVSVFLRSIELTGHRPN